MSRVVNGHTIFSFAVAAVVAFLLFQSREWPFSSGIFPWVAGFPALIFAFAQLLQDVRISLKGGERKVTRVLDTPTEGPSITPRDERDRGLRLLAWIFGLVFIGWLFGFRFVLAAFILLYLVLQARMSWWASLLTAGAFLGLTIGFFDKFAHISFPESLFFR